MTDQEQANVRAMLISVRFPQRDIEWMVASCPSIALCKALCKQPSKWWLTGLPSELEWAR